MFPPGTIIANRYEVIRLVGQGGMSNLYLCKDRKYQNALVVIKEMTAAYSDPKEQQMAVNLFHREAKLLASLNHRHIPKVYDYFQFQGKYYLSMEFVDGEDLGKKLMQKPGPMDEKQVAEWGKQMATVLYYLHVHKPPIVFRDVKPSNIMITGQGVKLIDFGIARHFDVAKKGDTMRIGSPGYAPPEQYSGQTDPRSDVYALGVTLHHAVTGRDPTTTNTPFILPPPRDLNPNCSQQMADIISKATQLDPASRYQNMLEMKRDLAAIINPAGTSGTRVVTGPPPTPKNRPGSTVPHSGPPPTTPQQNTQQKNPDQNKQPQTAAQGASAQQQGATPAQQQTNGQAAKPKKKRFPVAAVLLVLCLVGGSVVLAIKNPELTDRGSELLIQLRQQLFANSIPQEPLEAANYLYQAGAPAAVCWQKLSQANPEQQETPAGRILAANLLAEMSQRPRLKVGALVSQDDQAVLGGLAEAQQFINGAGGVDGQLVELQWLPVSTEDGPARPLRSLSKGSGRVLTGQPPTPPALILDFTQEATESGGPPLVAVGGKEFTRSSIPDLTPPLAQMVKRELEGAMLWMLDTEAPSDAQKATPTDGIQDFSSGTVVIQASDAEAILKEIEKNPKLRALVIADLRAELPPAQERASALVRFSPLLPGGRASRLASSYQELGASPKAALAFDALAYAAHSLTTPDRTFRGATLVINADKEARPASWASLGVEKGQWVYLQQVEVSK